MVEVQIDPESLPEVASNSVIRLGWRITILNAKLRQLSAIEHTVERLGQDVWQYSFELLLKWSKSSNGLQIIATVCEKEMQWTQSQCAQKVEEILSAITEDSARYKNADEEMEPCDIYGSARWANDIDLGRANYKYEQKHSGRFLLAPHSKNEHLAIPEAESHMHAVVCGPTGCGKSSTIFIPNLAERTGISAIVTEATAGNEQPDLFAKTAGPRKDAGQCVYYFNPDDLKSHRINPLSYVRTYGQAVEVARLLIENTSSKYTRDAKIWEDSESQLLTVLIMHAVGEGEHLGTIRRWLRLGSNGLGMLLMNSQIPEVREEFWAFFHNSTDGFKNSVLSGLMQRLNLWVNPRIVALTEATDIDFDQMSEQLFTFYMAVPAQKEHLTPLSALIFNFILQMVLEKNFKHSLGLFLDEFTNFGYVPGIAKALTIIRHKGIPATLGFQDFVQLKEMYGESNATLLFGQPGTKIFFRPRDLATARKISESLGTRTIVQRKTTSTGQIQEREIGRPLMDAGEIMALKKGHAIVFTPSAPPNLLKTFTWQDYEHAIKVPAPQFRALIVDEQLRKTCRETQNKPDWQKDWESHQSGKARTIRTTANEPQAESAKPEKAPRKESGKVNHADGRETDFGSREEEFREPNF
ncbi:unnamed protein product [Sphagnum balticum]